jgi:anti-anti-sigma factor
MKIETKVLDNDIKQITLAGRLDIQGTAAVENSFTYYSATEKAAVLVDMSQVDFISSTGMRMLVSNAKALARRGGKMVVLNPQPLIQEALQTAGIDALTPIYNDFEEACTALKAAVS